MYTKCPSCRSEICFEPPTNAANLPDGYKHRIKCPNCGVIIGVKIPRQDTFIETYPTYTPQFQTSASMTPIYQAEEAVGYPAAGGKIKPAKKSGISRNLVMFFLSLIFVGVCVFGYLLSANIIQLENEFLVGFNYFGACGIGTWEAICTDFDGFKILFEAMNISQQIYILVPLLIFTLASINVIVTFACMIAKKYSRTYGLISSVAIGGFSIYSLFAGFLAFKEIFSSSIAEYFKAMFEGKDFITVIVAALGLIMIIFGLIFLKSMKKKQN